MFRLSAQRITAGADNRNIADKRLARKLVWLRETNLSTPAIRLEFNRTIHPVAICLVASAAGSYKLCKLTNVGTEY